MRGSARTWRLRRLGIRISGAALALALPAVSVADHPAAASGSHAQIEGAGSSWSYNSIKQWILDVQQNGLQVVYTPVGSAQGRLNFANSTTDFAVSDIGYQGSDPVTGTVDASQRPYAYLPIVAGGTAFPYQVRVSGQLVRNIRLSQLTIAKIFTNQITNWNDPAITADNNGRQLPSIPIVPVVHSEGAGTTAQFSTWLSKEFPALWKSYSGYPEFTEYWPRQGSQIAENGSDGVMNFVTSAAANGAIGVDEYSYALQKGYPVAKVQNSAGYFTAPTQYDVAVALTQAQINTDKSSPNYLLQDLSNVYTYNDPRVYPLSSYSYLIEPTSSTDSRMSTAKAQTLADYLYYATCQGQAEIGPIGYSPLPINLVQASFDQVAKLHDAFPGVDLTAENVASCNNPTFIAGQPNRNYLAEIAPQPPACDKSGAGPCSADAGIITGNPKNGQAPAGPSTSGAATSRGASAGHAATAVAASTNAGASVGAATTVAANVDPLAGDQASTGSASADGSSILGTPTLVAAGNSSGLTTFLAVLAVALLLMVLTVPPLLAAFGKRPRGGA